METILEVISVDSFFLIDCFFEGTGELIFLNDALSVSMTPAMPTLGTDIVYTCENWISVMNDTGTFLVHYWLVSTTLVKRDLTQIKGTGTGTVMHASPVSLIAVKHIQIPKLFDTNLSETEPIWYLT